MTAPPPETPPTAAAGLARPIPIRHVSRAAIAALVRQLVADGVVQAPTFSVSPD